MSIDVEAYTSEETFRAEIDRVFSKRLYVGSARELSEINSYRADSLDKKSFTLRNTPHGIRAFDNVCLHRCALIDTPGEGTKEFRCPYHGWSYDSEGLLRSAPLIDQQIQRRGLRRYPVSQIGDLLFLGLNGETPCVEKIPGALSQIGIPLEDMQIFHRDSFVQDSNWKLVVENNIEAYHLSFVHPQSFMPAGFNSRSSYEWGYDDYTCWHACVPTAHTTKLPQLQKLTASATHEFRHVYIFPNLFFSATNSMVGFRNQIVPLSSSQTRMEWELFELPAMKALRPALREHLRQEAIRFTATSLLEDRPIVESCQRGLASPAAAPQLQSPDSRIARFHRYYAEQMNHVDR